MASAFIDPDVQKTFRRSSNGYMSHSLGGLISCPPYVIASVAADLLPEVIALPEGYTADVLDQVRYVTGFINRDVAVSPRQADELAEIGAQILALDQQGTLSSALTPYERMSVQHLITVVSAR